MLSGPSASPLLMRRNCSKNGTIAAGFSIGIPAVRSIIPETSSDACARATRLTAGGFGTVRRLATVFFFFFFFADELGDLVDAPVVEVFVVEVCENRKNGAAARTSQTGAAGSFLTPISGPPGSQPP